MRYKTQPLRQKVFLAKCISICIVAISSNVGALPKSEKDAAEKQEITNLEKNGKSLVLVPDDQSITLDEREIRKLHNKMINGLKSSRIDLFSNLVTSNKVLKKALMSIELPCDNQKCWHILSVALKATHVVSMSIVKHEDKCILKWSFWNERTKSITLRESFNEFICGVEEIYKQVDMWVQRWKSGKDLEVLVSDLAIGKTIHTVFKGLTRRQIRKTIAKRRCSIRKCYKKVLKKSRSLEGRIILLFTITKSGNVTSMKTIMSTLKNSKLEDCIESAVKTLIFPKPEGNEDIIVAYPFNLRLSPK